MITQSALDPRTIDTVLCAVVSSYTSTLTITARTIAVGSPVIIETSSNSLPSTTTDSSVVQQWARRPATSTSLVNNLTRGLLAAAPRAAYLDSGERGLVHCHGIYPNALVQRSSSADMVAGNALVPESLQFLIAASGPVTAAATATAGHVEAPALGLLFALIQSVASSSATETARAAVLVRCM